MSDYKTIGPACRLGEGPLWHPTRERLFWVDILNHKMFSANAFGGQSREWNFGEPVSELGWVDRETLMVATASGFQKFDLKSSSWETIAALEADNPVTRTNDGRVGPDGSFWVGTMGQKFEERVGSYYRYKNGEVTKLFGDVTVPNATCFSPDGKTAYFTDTRKRVIWRWALNEDGDPQGEPQEHINLREEGWFPDGAVCDSEGYLWNAHWGAWQIGRYAPDGSLDRIIKLPVSQPTCPAFGGDGLKTLYITSAKGGLSEEQLLKEPDAGKIIVLDVGISGLPETAAII